MRIEDILHPDEGRFLSHTELNEKYDLQLSFHHALQIRQSIPGGWRARLSPSGSPPIVGSILLTLGPGPPVDLFEASSQSLYAGMIRDLNDVIKSQAKWEMELQGTVNILDWPGLYRLPFSTARETKLQALQYKILHRILPCCRFLKAIRLAPEDTCAFCPDRDTIVQFLYDCAKTKSLWTKIAGWLTHAGGPNLSLLPA